MSDRGLVLSHHETRPLLAARQQGSASATASGDLGRTTETVAVLADGVQFAGRPLVPWPALERIAAATTKCFVVTGAELVEARIFSPTTGWVRSLYPTGSAPTTLVAGFTMHRIQGIDPREDTVRKVHGARPLTGRVLDTATGLGYTAILAAAEATEVVTVELDPSALELARANPWSDELFQRPNITRVTGSVAAVIEGFADASFARVIHDPPSLKLAGELYSAAFYAELHRVLAPRGRLSHYIGDPSSPSGRSTTRGVIERLRAAGFRTVTPAAAAYGVVAIK